ncbi:MAG TPA: stage III sporulation protein AC [Candidatus Pullichristensenella avicola]|nr:stage III sporulation protein AC [Candidatus Pullichristensenella avicola]
MDMDFVFRIAAIGILTSVVSIVLTRAGREDVAMLATLSGLVVVLLMVVNMLAGFFDSVRAVFQLA